MKYPLTRASVFIAIPVNRDFPWQTTASLVSTVETLVSRSIPYEMRFNVNGSLIAKSRCLLARDFLISKCTHLFWVDSDISWSPTDFLRVLHLGTMMDIVGAAYPSKNDDLDFKIVIGDERMRQNEHGCVSLKGMGLGFTVCQRHVIEALARMAPSFVDDDGTTVPEVFRTGVRDGRFFGEDINFFRDCADIGSPLWVDPKIELGHVGAKVFRAALIETMKKAG